MDHGAPLLTVSFNTHLFVEMMDFGRKHHKQTKGTMTRPSSLLPKPSCAISVGHQPNKLRDFFSRFYKKKLPWGAGQSTKFTAQNSLQVSQICSHLLD